MARYGFLDDGLRLTARAEYFDDADGLQLAGPFLPRNRVYEGTLGVAWPVTKGAELRLEGRQDRVVDGVLPSGHSYQTTVQAAALAWF